MNCALRRPRQSPVGRVVFTVSATLALLSASVLIGGCPAGTSPLGDLLGGNGQDAGATNNGGTNGGNDTAGSDALDPGKFQGESATLPAGSAAEVKLVDISDAREGALAYIDLDGQNIIYAFGKRDGEGAIEALEALLMVNTVTGQSWQVTLDSAGLPDQLIDGDVTIDMLWNSDGTFVLYRDDLRVEGALPDDALPLFASFQEAAATRGNPGTHREISTSAIVKGICAPLGMVAGLVLGTYTSPLWAGATIVGATAAGITGAYNAAYGATETPPPPDLQQAMNVVDAVGTLTSIADLGNGVITTLARKPAADIEVIETLSILNNIQGLAEPVTTGVRTALFTQTRGGYTVIAQPDQFVIYISPAQADLNFFSYVDSPIQADNQGFYTDARGRGVRVLRPLGQGQTATITIWGFTAGFEAPQTFSFTF